MVVEVTFGQLKAQWRHCSFMGILSPILIFVGLRWPSTSGADPEIEEGGEGGGGRTY